MSRSSQDKIQPPEPRFSAQTLAKRGVDHVVFGMSSLMILLANSDYDNF